MTVTHPIALDYAPGSIRALPDAADLGRYLSLPTTLSTDVQADLELACQDAADYQLTRLSYNAMVNDGANPPSTVPGPVARATLQYAAALWRRRNSVNGFDGYDDLGTVPVRGNDPDIERLLDRWRAWVYA